MAKSSSIYMGEGKMALSGKWQKALIACFVAIGISIIPSFINTPLNYSRTFEYSNSTTELSFAFSFIGLIWAIFVTLPLTYSCTIGLRQMHIANEQPMDVMFDKFKHNWKRYVKLGIKVGLRIMAIIAIPLVLYVFLLFSVFFAAFFNVGSIDSSIMGLPFLCIIACIVGYCYKYFEYIFVPFVVNDNPEMTDKEVLSKSSTLSKGQKWTMFKIYLRALIPVLLLFIIAFIVILVPIIIMIGGFAMFGTLNNFSLLNWNFILIFIVVYLIATILMSSFIFLRTKLPLSVLYSELTGYNDKNDEPMTPVLLPEDGLTTTVEEAAKEEEKKIEPEMPYEQKYMPKSETTSESDSSVKGDDNKDDSDIPYEQRYMPK